MVRIVLANVGTSDIAFNVAAEGQAPLFLAPNKWVTDCPTLEAYFKLPPRSGCGAIASRIQAELANWNGDDVRRAIRFPLLTPALETFIQNHGAPDRIVLFATQQSPPHRDDTIDIARIAERWLPLIAAQPALAERIEIVPVNHNPTLFDEALKTFEKWCEGLCEAH